MTRNLYPNDDALAVEAATSPRALSTLISRNAYRIASYARRSAGRHWYTADRPDIKQQARLGVCTAVAKFDPERAKFWTYAQHWIRHEVTRWLAYCGQPVRYPASEYTTRKSEVAWLDQPIGEDGFTLGDLIDRERATIEFEEPALEPTSEVLMAPERRELATVAVRDLTPESGYVVRRRVLEHVSVPQVAREMWLDEIAVAMIERCAIYDMRKAVQLKLFEAA